jgi:hypothetical protein
MGNMTVIITKKAQAMAKAKQRIIPKLIANEMLNFALDNFRRQGYLGDTFEPWKKRKPVARKESTRALLIKTGRGRRSLRVIEANEERVGIGSDLIYMKAHNEGVNQVVHVNEYTREVHRVATVGTGIYSVKSKKERMKKEKFLYGHAKVKAHNRRMKLPKRQFIGKSQYLMARLKRVYAAEIIKAFNS